MRLGARSCRFSTRSRSASKLLAQTAQLEGQVPQPGERKSQRRKMAKRTSRPSARADLGCEAGVVGMGLMGTSIAACLLAAGHRLSCVESDPAKLKSAPHRLRGLLQNASEKNLYSPSPSSLMELVTISGELSSLAHAEVVIESTVEDLAVKREVIHAIEAIVPSSTLIGSNTSAILVSDLQSGAKHPERILGLHWAEPANITRFMEIICGKATSAGNLKRAVRFACSWGKEPSVVRKEIRGFITNRIMYAMLREAFYLVDSGYASVADVDRSLRNDLGYWITFAGPFRFMDLTGIPAYAAVMKDLLPDLNCSTEVPSLMQKVIRSGARGVSNAKGFYRYTPSQAKRWEELFIDFSHEIRRLAEKYPENVGDKRTPKRTGRE
jgi:3-hydroxybutyryl-CoA dehydrogenase